MNEYYSFQFPQCFFLTSSQVWGILIFNNIFINIAIAKKHCTCQNEDLQNPYIKRQFLISNMHSYELYWLKLKANVFPQ